MVGLPARQGRLLQCCHFGHRYLSWPWSTYLEPQNPNVQLFNNNNNNNKNNNNKYRYLVYGGAMKLDRVQGPRDWLMAKVPPPPPACSVLLTQPVLLYCSLDEFSYSLSIPIM